MGHRRLNWAGCANVRDLGGLPTKDGDHIRTGALIRSDSPHWLTEQGCAALRSSGVRRILDLRSEDEAELDLSPFSDPAHAEPAYILLPLIDPAREHERERDTERSHAAIYIGSLSRNGERIAAGLATIADAPDGAVLVHCHAGKDRTGIVVALALRLAGVAPGVIAADYALSADCLRERHDADLARIAAESDREELRALQQSEPETILAMLAAVDGQHGGVSEYLRQHGLCAQQQDRLLARLRD